MPERKRNERIETHGQFDRVQRVFKTDGGFSVRQSIKIRNFVDEDGNPAGGFVVGTGLQISFQDGPLGRGADRKAPNGAFVEDIIRGCAERLEFYQRGKFKCSENEKALTHLQMALEILEARTSRREAEQTEGTHEGT
jgi:hypothetical protein